MDALSSQVIPQEHPLSRCGLDLSCKHYCINLMTFNGFPSLKSLITKFSYFAKKMIDSWTSLSKRGPRTTKIESISQVKWTDWEECDFCRYNDLFESCFCENVFSVNSQSANPQEAGNPLETDDFVSPEDSAELRIRNCIFV